MTTTTSTVRWTPELAAEGTLIVHSHADGDAHSHRHAHRLLHRDQPHHHGTLRSEPVDVASFSGIISDDRVRITRAQDGEVSVRVDSPSFMLGLIVDALAEVVSADLDLADMPADPDSAAEWVREHLRPLTHVTTTLVHPVDFARELADIIPGV